MKIHGEFTSYISPTLLLLLEHIQTTPLLLHRRGILYQASLAPSVVQGGGLSDGLKLPE